MPDQPQSELSRNTPPLPVPVPAPTSQAKPGRVVVIGAGPAGLTCAYQLGKAGVTSQVVEAMDAIGGISQTVERDGWRFDIGGHRFFTKVPEVEKFWHEVLPDDDFMMRPRLSRIMYQGKLFDYPLKASNALKNLGILEAVRCVLSYLWVRVNPPKDQSNFEGWVAARFGWRLYNIFFKTYTEKVWGVPATEIQADWAAQRIKNLSLGKAIVHALLPSKKNSKEVTSLIGEFQYPKLGPGMMWERCAELVMAQGSKIDLNQPVIRIERGLEGARAVIAKGPDGVEQRFDADHVVSSMPLNHLAEVMDPPAPDHVLQAARSLHHRDFLTVAVIVDEKHGFEDNWTYIHTPGVKVGRIQNFGSWSPYMVKPGKTCLGLEYFVSIGDDVWSMDDDVLVELAKQELLALGLVPEGGVEKGYVFRMPRAYPVYDPGYAGHVATIRAWLEEELPNVHPIGRNGLHHYDNSDSASLTGMLAAENILGASHDVWAVNVEEDYHEEQTGKYGGPAPSRTGRDAPVLPTPKFRTTIDGELQAIEGEGTYPEEHEHTALRR